jgi:hypothetical protein
MSGGRPRTLLVAALSLAAGLLAGLRVAARLEPATRAAAPGPAVENAAQLRNELARAEVGVALRVTVLREGRRRLLGIAVEEAGGGA